MKRKKMGLRKRRVRLARLTAGYGELDRFFDRHDAAELMEQGVMEIDPVRMWVIEGMRREATQP